MSQESEESLEAWLHRLEWSQLLSLQKQLVSEMDRRYVEIIQPQGQNIQDDLDEYMKDGLSSYDDLPSTQFDPIHVKKNATVKSTIEQEHAEPLARERNQGLQRDLELMSSPLKENEIILDSQASDILKENDINIQHSHQSVIAKSKRGRSPINATTMPQANRNNEKENIKRGKISVDFSINPITKKPWIYEDFKINELVSSKNRGRGCKKSNKVARFHAQAGSPLKSKQNVVLNSTGLLETVDETSVSDRSKVPDLQFPDDSFDNLRVRSKSPPGYGRLNFPTTQERLDDKEESRKLLYQKTKTRFLEATNNLVPISDREFYFRNSKLNDIVDDGNFTWNENELKIFTR